MSPGAPDEELHYTTPDGKALNTVVEVSEYLETNPGCLSHFVTQIYSSLPQPLPGWAARRKVWEGRGKKAPNLPPLAKQLARKLLSANISKQVAQRLLRADNGALNPPLFPLPPPVSTPQGPPLVQPLGTRARFYPPACNSPNLPIRAAPSNSLLVPLLGSLHQARYASGQARRSTCSSQGQAEAPVVWARKKHQQQKSRLGPALRSLRARNNVRS